MTARRSKIFMIWAGIRWLLLMFCIAPVVEAPAIVHPSRPSRPILVWHVLGSWYGSEFQDKPTASGEPYDEYADTAAHLTLPLGSLVRVVNPMTGRSRVVRINDRGPYVEGREIDVSYGVARSLGFDQRGLAHLRIELLHVPQRR